MKPAIAIALAALAAPALPAAFALPADPATPLHSSAGASLRGYDTPVAVAAKDATPTYVNDDLFLHNVVAKDAFGPANRPWCAAFPTGRCPLFWTPLIGLAQSTTVRGLDRAEPGAAYAFYCTLHAAMRGTLVIAPEAIA